MDGEEIACEKMDRLPPQCVQEGKAEIFSPAHVFYNPVQEFNRDLTVAVISEHIRDHFHRLRKSQHKKEKDHENIETVDLELPEAAGIKYAGGVRIFEALAASGLRSVRFALEIPGVKEIIANDFDENAVNFIKRNIAHNKVDDLVTASYSDASMVMYMNRKSSDRFDVIDLDPYGSAAPFLDSAVQALADGGLLCVTCTDMAILAGNAPEACHAKYQAMSLRAKFCHEQALRILLQCIESHANRYSRYIVPILSISADFYVRVFVRLYTGQNKVKESVTKLSMIYHCVGCGQFKLQPLAYKLPTSKEGNYKYTAAHGPVASMHCDLCNSRQHLGGPIWNAPIHDVEFVKRVIGRMEKYPERFGTADRIRGMLSVVSEELQEVPLYYVCDDLSKIVHCNPMKMMELRSAILHAGYEVSYSHTHKNSIKTSAPMNIIWDIFRCWIKKNPINEKHLQEGSIVKSILSVEPSIEAVFSEHPEANPASRRGNLLRWQQNPEKDWGPKARATKGENAAIETRRKKGCEKAQQKKQKVDTQDATNFHKQFPCKRLEKGLCGRGENCKYSHSLGIQVDKNTLDRSQTMETSDSL